MAPLEQSYTFTTCRTLSKMSRIQLQKKALQHRNQCTGRTNSQKVSLKVTSFVMGSRYLFRFTPTQFHRSTFLELLFPTVPVFPCCTWHCQDQSIFFIKWCLYNTAFSIVQQRGGRIYPRQLQSRANGWLVDFFLLKGLGD